MESKADIYKIKRLTRLTTETEMAVSCIYLLGRHTVRIRCSSRMAFYLKECICGEIGVKEIYYRKKISLLFKNVNEAVSAVGVTFVSNK